MSIVNEKLFEIRGVHWLLFDCFWLWLKSCRTAVVQFHGVDNNIYETRCISSVLSLHKHSVVCLIYDFAVEKFKVRCIRMACAMSCVKWFRVIAFRLPYTNCITSLQLNRSSFFFFIYGNSFFFGFAHFKSTWCLVCFFFCSLPVVMFNKLQHSSE